MVNYVTRNIFDATIIDTMETTSIDAVIDPNSGTADDWMGLTLISPTIHLSILSEYLYIPAL